MGIYPDERYQKQRNGNLVHTVNTPGLLVTTVYVPVVTIESRDNCYCCSCFEADDQGTQRDPYCRNHGWMGERPCEDHDMPGTVDEDMEALVSVQAKRRSHDVRGF